ncbi:hypothetical protein BV20DRAFT_609555 [Pilatotrama ljubarskyi]|nr:hypothetical protein BV20DRAFT_609555 [Pilatotrama ljubarskyi]
MSRGQHARAVRCNQPLCCGRSPNAPRRFKSTCIESSPESITGTITESVETTITIQHAGGLGVQLRINRAYRLPTMPTTEQQQASTEADQAAQEPKFRIASDPFNRDDADLIVRTSDNVDFHVHRLILSLASPVFAAMLTFPQPPGTDPQRPVVDLLEDSETLDVFFRVLYPLTDPEERCFPLIRKVLAAAMKYEASAVIASMRRAFPSLVKDDPPRVFAIACLFGMEEEAKVAAKEAVIANRVIESACVELDEIPAGAYYRLLKLHRTRKTTRRSKLDRGVTVDFDGIGPFCAALNSARTSRPPITRVDPAFDSSGTHSDLILG